MTSERAALSAHLLIRDAAAWPQTLVAAQRLLAERYGIDHVTLQPAWHAAPGGKRVIPVDTRRPATTSRHSCTDGARRRSARLTASSSS